MLLINPEVEKTTVYTEKPNLVVALDNSESIKHLEQDSSEMEFHQTMLSNQNLKDHFNVVYYNLGNGITPFDTLSFNETETNIDKAFKELSQIYKNTVLFTMLLVF